MPDKEPENSETPAVVLPLFGGLDPSGSNQLLQSVGIRIREIYPSRDIEGLERSVAIDDRIRLFLLGTISEQEMGALQEQLSPFDLSSDAVRWVLAVRVSLPIKVRESSDSAS